MLRSGRWVLLVVSFLGAAGPGCSCGRDIVYLYGDGGGGGTGHVDAGAQPCGWAEWDDGLVGGRAATVQFDPRSGLAWAASASRVWRSDPSASSWELISEAPAGFYHFAFPADDPAVILAASASGIWRSDDLGAHWVQLSLGGLGWTRVAMHSAEGALQRVYASSRAVGVVVSPDGGESWGSPGRGLPRGDVLALDADPIDPGVVLAAGALLTDADGWSSDGFIARSEDGGQSWDVVQAGGRVHALARCPADQRILVAGTIRGGLTSVDGGSTWVTIPTPVGRVVAVAIGGEACTDVLASVEPVGLVRSSDGGMTWDGPYNEGFVLSRPAPLQLATSPDAFDLVLASTHGGVYRSANAGLAWDPIGGVGDIAIREMEVAPGSSIVTLSTWGAGAWSRQPGTAWSRLALGDVPEDYVIGFWHRGGESYVGGAGTLYRGVEATFARVRDGNVFDIAVDPLEPDTRWAATQTTGVLRSEDRGETWSARNGALAPWSTPYGVNLDVRAIIPVAGADGTRTLIAATYGRGMIGSDDDGLSWYSLFDDPAARWLVCLRDSGVGESPRFFACSEDAGILVSDDGRAWYTLNDGLSSLQVNGVARHDRDVFAVAGGVLHRLEGEVWTPAFAEECRQSLGRIAVVDDASGDWLLAATSDGRMLRRPL